MNALKSMKGMAINMTERFSRTELIFGEEAMKRLAAARVAVFGVGGVGGYAVEALARSGVGAIDLIDDDRVSLSNLNRQIIALKSTIGQYKVDAAAARIRDINPECRVNAIRAFFTPETAAEFDFTQFDYVIDAIDTVSGKIALAECCDRVGTRLISSMGAGNKLDPTAFEVADIYKTSVCPLARVMRYELKRRGIKRLKVVYSKEQPLSPTREAAPQVEGRGSSAKKIAPGSNAFVPSVAGLILAGEVIKELAGLNM